jgi:hypothetical protein
VCAHVHLQALSFPRCCEPCTCLCARARLWPSLPPARRFCQPGMLTRPARDVDPERVVAAVVDGMRKTG